MTSAHLRLTAEAESTFTPLYISETVYPHVTSAHLRLTAEVESTFTPLSISETVYPQQPLIPLETTCSTDTFAADDPEALLSSITSGQCQIVENGKVNAPAYDLEIQRNVNESHQGIASENGPDISNNTTVDSVWNNDVRLFLSLTYRVIFIKITTRILRLIEG